MRTRRTTSTGTRRSIAALVVAALALAGCGTEATTVTGGPGPGPGDTTVPGGTTVPGTLGDLPADQVVWQVNSGGGLVPYTMTLGSLPTVTIYGDGRAIATANGEFRPGHPWAQDEGRVAPGDLTRFLVKAKSSGLFDGRDIESPQVTDLGTTVAMIHTDGPAHKVSAYALDDNFDDDLSGDAAARRSEFRTLIEASIDLVKDRHRWVPDRVSIIEVHADMDTGDTPPPTPWPGPPLAAVLQPAGDNVGYDRCGVITGEDARRVLEADAKAVRTDNRWTDRGNQHTLVLRLLLPGESGCRR
ncbi:MAG: hypothetical protein ACR2MB_10995 [Acidimicrobiales bacterium]